MSVLMVMYGGCGYRYVRLNCEQLGEGDRYVRLNCEQLGGG